ncbi:MAG: hypothetical protein COB02_09505 [Candidatus Cloacimonadota bacterium]|nr:MAG: hypothetical protein COB02_09505 [Candidatus Cloacimonadota bacterium]
MIFFYIFLAVIFITIISYGTSLSEDPDKVGSRLKTNISEKQLQDMTTYNKEFSLAICSDQECLASKSILKLSPIFERFHIIKEEDMENYYIMDKEDLYFSLELAKNQEEYDYEEISTVDYLSIDYEWEDKKDLQQFIKKIFSLADEIGWKIHGYNNECEITGLLSRENVLVSELSKEGRSLGVVV